MKNKKIIPNLLLYFSKITSCSIPKYILLLFPFMFFFSFTPIFGQDLLWGTYFGLKGNVRALAVDDTGNVYVTGLTTAKDLATPGAQQQVPSKVYLAKFNKDGKRIWCTYYAQNGSSMSLTLDKKGNIIMTGYASAHVNPNQDVIITTPGAHQEKFVSPANTTYGEDAFIAKYNNEGKLLWATLYGGNKFDALNAVATDDEGNIFVAGGTESDISETEFSTPGAHQEKWIYPVAGVLAKFSSEGKRLWSTYYGGERRNSVQSISLDPSGNVYITGSFWEGKTLSDPYLYVTPGAHLTTVPSPGGDAAYIAKFDTHGKRIWGTYYGGGIREDASSIDVDKDYNVYIGGFSKSQTGVATSGTHQPVFGGMQDAFLAKLDSSGKRLWGTYFGGTETEGTAFIKCHPSGDVYLTTATKSTSNIATPGAYKDTLTVSCELCYDVVLAKFNSAGQRLWSTYYGGRQRDASTAGIAVDTAGNMYVAGLTYSPDGIATKGSFQDSLASEFSSFIAKFGFAPKDTNTTSIGSRNKKSNFLRLYPNPANTTVNLQYDKLTEGSYTLQAIDMLGREVVRQQLQLKYSRGMHSLNVQDWKKGIYMIRLYNANGFNYEERIIISH